MGRSPRGDSSLSQSCSAFHVSCSAVSWRACRRQLVGACVWLESACHLPELYFAALSPAPSSRSGGGVNKEEREAAAGSPCQCRKKEASLVRDLKSFAAWLEEKNPLLAFAPGVPHSEKPSMAADVPPTLSIQLVEEPRLLKLKKLFVSKFESTPKFFVRAPGRVNLIGEHIDYCGYAVLPMAIEQDILIAAEPLSTPVIHLANTNPLYSDFCTDANSVEIDQTKPLWHNYFLCGFKGIQDHFGFGSPSGINCLIEGTIPPSSGLSSSSALVCCAALVTLMAEGKTLPKVEMAELCTKSERYIGTEGGGMDQSICFLAEKGTAKLIEFNPLRATDVRLPGRAAFVIANSCVEMNKAATSHFNIRVMECRLATKLLAKSRGLDWKATAKLQDVQVKLKLSLKEMLTVVEEVLHPEPYSIEEIGGYLGMSSEELRTQVLSQNTQDVTTFKLYQRAKHVYSEAARVLEFKKICKEAPANAAQLLGDLMNESHASCKDLYECSCPELDRLVDICLQFGALGSRLTGAGWGGCTVSMVPEGKLEGFLAHVKDAYYKNNSQRLMLEENSLFATSPGGGAMGFFEA